MTYFQESEDSHSQPTLFGETLNTSSAKSTPSARTSSKSTGRKPPTTRTSGSLLPTPQASDFVGTVQEKNHSLRHLEHGTGWARKLLPTPNARDVKDTGENTNYEKIAAKSKLAGVVALSSRGGSHVSPFLPPDEDEERKMTAISGRRCLQLYETLRPTGLLRKTLEGLLTGTKAWYSNKCALTWKEKVTKSGRLLFQLSPRVRRTEGTGFGSSPERMAMTPKASDGYMGTPSTSHRSREKSTHLSTQVSMLETPTQSDWKGRGPNSKQGGLDKRIAHPTGTKTGLKLQPAFVEWMMGFPEGWCDFPMEPPSAKPVGGKKR